MRRHQLTRTVLAVVGLSILGSACTLEEDGSYWLEDGTTGCLLPSWGCSGPLVDPITKTGPPPLPAPLLARRIVGIPSFDCASAPTFAPGLDATYLPNYETGDGVCDLEGTAEDFAQLDTSAWSPNVG